MISIPYYTQYVHLRTLTFITYTRTLRYAPPLSHPYLPFRGSFLNLAKTPHVHIIGHIYN